MKRRIEAASIVVSHIYREPAVSVSSVERRERAECDLLTDVAFRYDRPLQDIRPECIQFQQRVPLP